MEAGILLSNTHYDETRKRAIPAGNARKYEFLEIPINQVK